MNFHRITAPLALALAAAFGPAHADPFTLWITETPAGGTAQYNAQLKGGIRSYVFDGLGYTLANVSAGATIAASGLNDPSSVLMDASGTLVVSNRGFNSGFGSVSTVTFSGGVPNAPAAVLSNLDTGPHQAALTGNGGLIVSSLGSGAKLYPNLSAPATVSYATGTERGAAVLGSVFYSTSASGTLQSFDIASGALLGNFGVGGASLLHYATVFNGSLYLADIGANATGAGGGVYKVTLDASGAPVSSSRVANVNGAISVAFSPSGDEMFVASHFDGTLTGFALSGGNVAATSNFFLDGGTLASWGGAHVQYGGMATPVPEAGTWALMLGGLAAIGLRLRRRR